MKPGYNSDYKSYMRNKNKPLEKPVVNTKKHVSSKIKFDEFINEQNGNLKKVQWFKTKQSYGEKRVQEWLDANNIQYKPEKEFKDLVNPNTGQKLRMDFFLPKHKICIEFDGKQHFQECKKFDGNDTLFKRKQRDAIKDRFCIYRGIQMIRIKYTETSLIEDILKQAILR